MTDSTTEIMMDEALVQKLLPCPFCGEQPDSRFFGDDDGGYQVIACHACECAQVHRDDEETAIQSWNTRALQSRPADAVEEDTAWLIERRVEPPQWSTESSPTGVGAFFSDVHRAYRFPTENAAQEAMRRMHITPKERGEYFVSEHKWVEVVPKEDEAYAWLKKYCPMHNSCRFASDEMVIAYLAGKASIARPALDERGRIVEYLRRGIGRSIPTLDPTWTAAFNAGIDHCADAVERANHITSNEREG